MHAISFKVILFLVFDVFLFWYLPSNSWWQIIIDLFLIICAAIGIFTVVTQILAD
ncbi:hypothetical protein FC16_GL001926 [Loigolactobacillus coryniformis subsp. torquens DSM 20004 = KCTC 3535]|mgnify:FL=1|nr:hypothetical protein FC16_GL001926 [Loigolactobacillus coryniformis subsp. torquens DSM 20004 = KCTC 3535]